MEILIPTQTEAEFGKLRDAVLSAAEQAPHMEGMQMRFRRIRTDVASALVSLLSAEYRHPIVLPVDAVDGDAKSVQRLINRIDNPVLIVW